MRKPRFYSLRLLVFIGIVLFQVLGPVVTEITNAQEHYDYYAPDPINGPGGYATQGNNSVSNTRTFDGAPVDRGPTAPVATGSTYDGAPVNRGPTAPVATGSTYDGAPVNRGPNADTQEGPAFEVVQNAYQTSNNNMLYNILVGAGGFVSGLGGVVFDYTFRVTVNEFGCMFVADGCAQWKGEVGGIVNDLWKVIRDLFNIVFIFSLVYIGLRLILLSDDSATQKSIGKLIGAALLVNFSLYIAKLIVDIANYTAVQIHHAMTSGIEGQFAIGDYFELQKHSISGAFMEVLRIATWFGYNGDSKDPIEGFQAVILGIFSFIFLCYLGFIFLYGALMLMARVIAIIILLIFSPMMFLGWVLPQFQKYSSQWLAMFIGYSFYIPAYVFLLYMSLMVMIQMASGIGKRQMSYSKPLADGSAVNAADFSIYFIFFMGAGLLYASTKVAGIISKSGAGATMNMAGNWAGKMSTGLAAAGAGSMSGWAGRGLIGGKGGDTLKRWSESIEAKNGKSGWRSRALKRASSNLEGRKYGSSYSLADKRKAVSEGDRRAAGLQNRQQAEEALALPTAGNEAAKQRALSKLSKDEIVAMSKTGNGRKLLEDNAQFLTADHIKSLTEDKEKDVGAVSAIVAARGQAVKDKIDGGAKIKDLTSDDLAAMDYDKLVTPETAIHLTDDKIKNLPLVEAEKNDIKMARKDAYIKIVQEGTPVDVVDVNKLLNSDIDKIADLPNEVFDYTQFGAGNSKHINIKHFIRELPLNSLTKIQSKKGKEIAQKIRRELNVYAGTATATTGGRKWEIRNWLDNDNAGKNFGK